ncbi:hypothetical protein BH09MYX1_BH09MYX1_51810 [soil metagenome]
MRLSARALAVVLLAVSTPWVAACSLNPQPLPPDNGFDGADASTKGDAAGSSPDGSLFSDANQPFPDDARADGSTDAGDGSTDADTDGGNADAASDGSTDAVSE